MKHPRTFLAPTAVLLAAALAGCGGDNINLPPVSTPTPPPPPPPPSVVAEGSQALPSGALGRLTFTTPLPGRVDATVNWTFDDDDFDVVLVRGNCEFEQLVANQCDIAGFSQGQQVKPERVSASSVPAGRHQLFIGNLGPHDESLSFQVILTPSSATAAASRAPAATWEVRRRN
jgi:hypothetical protein